VEVLVPGEVNVYIVAGRVRPAQHGMKQTRSRDQFILQWKVELERLDKPVALSAAVRLCRQRTPGISTFIWIQRKSWSTDVTCSADFFSKMVEEVGVCGVIWSDKRPRTIDILTSRQRVYVSVLTTLQKFRKLFESRVPPRSFRSAPHVLTFAKWRIASIRRSERIAELLISTRTRKHVRVHFQIQLPTIPGAAFSRFSKMIDPFRPCSVHFGVIRL
jgi:hypothetical protein